MVMLRCMLDNTGGQCTTIDLDKLSSIERGMLINHHLYNQTVVILYINNELSGYMTFKVIESKPSFVNSKLYMMRNLDSIDIINAVKNHIIKSLP